MGLPLNEVDHTKIPGLNLDDWDYNPGYAINNLDRVPLTENINVCDTNGYAHQPDQLIGYAIGDSGSYGLIEITEVDVKLSRYRFMFNRLFDVEPKLYLF